MRQKYIFKERILQLFYLCSMKKINDISFAGKKVLIRVDFNVPLDDQFRITDDSRIVAALPTIRKVIHDGGKAIIMSHLGRPKDSFDEKFSLKHLVNHVSQLLGTTVRFCTECVGETAQQEVEKMKNADVLLLENLRFHSEEKKGDQDFAKALASLGEVFINDAFGAAHRAHASTAIIAAFFPEEKYFGFLMQSEIESLEKALSNPVRPFTAIIGGAKISGKIDVITSLLDKVDCLIIGGGMAYTFAKAKGGDVGNSLVEEEKIALAKELIVLAEQKGVKLLLPSDSINADRFSNDATSITTDILTIPENYMGLDIGEKSIQHFSAAIMASKTIIWNGPMGVFEMSQFEHGTESIGKAIARATQNGAFSLVGGGDSVAAVKQFNLADKVSYISTGGGAMLEYLEGKKLPGVEAIMN